jgi:hypothetical protein
MKKEQIEIDIRLERCPNYVKAKIRFTELQAELNCLDRQRDEIQTGISSLKNSHSDLIAEEAMSMLSGVPAADPSILRREEMVKTFEQLSRRIAVLRQAVALQRNILESARHEVGSEISLELLPQHRDNVSAVIEAAIRLSTALQAEAELRNILTERGIPFSSVIRAMPIHGFDLADGQSRLSRYLLECYEHALIGAGDLPDVVRDRLPPKVKSTPKPIARQANNEGWLLA